MSKKTLVLLLSALLVSACTESSDESNECTNDTWKCDGNTLYKCISENWEIINTCEGNTQCNADTKSCDANDNTKCTNGTWKCDGNDLSKCISETWESIKTCEGNTQCNAETGSCDKTENPNSECQDTEHLFANKCEADDVNHCGSQTKDCTKLSGWKSGDCIDKSCFAEACNAGYHLASHFDNNIEITNCEEDTHDACGSSNTKCGTDEICTNGECKESCKPGEVICGGSCINPQTSKNFCGADVSCSSYIACSEREDCISGKCVVSSCTKAEESLCTENEQNICVNIHGSNPNHCGACGAVCSDRETAKASGCAQGQCTYICKDNMVNCGSTTEPACLPKEQLQTDPLHCGNCDRTCADNEFCKDGKCTVSSCTGNECFFNNACINQNEHCGTQCLNCNTANLASAGTCQAGTCVITACITGYHLANGACQIDSATACPNGNAYSTVNCNTLDAYTKAGICVEAKCQAIACQQNAHLKDGKCIEDTPQKCGTSEINCTANAGWQSGKCENGNCIATSCKSGYCANSLSGQCTNEQSISACGIDGGVCKSCSQTQVCSAGKCIAKQCDGNVCNQGSGCKNDNTHCGTGCQNCNTFTSHATAGICLADGTCQVTACETDYHIYNNACEADSITNCGAHGTQCNVSNANNECKNKVCTFKCNDGFEQSNNKCVSDKFISTWNVEANGSVSFPIQGRIGIISIDWGDGNSDTVSTGTDASIKHQYSNPSAKLYTITVTGPGMITEWSCSKGGQVMLYCSHLVEIKSYGKTTFGKQTFRNAAELVSLPTDEMPKFLYDDLSYTFNRATKFNQNINFWDTSKVTNMSWMFSDDQCNNNNPTVSFNQPLNNWDTSKVTNMSRMFYCNKSFNQPLNNWDTSKVTDMSYMFSTATAFNQLPNNWDTSNVTNMSYMFSGATAFNQLLNNWDTSNVTDMSYMFQGAVAFNQPLNNWNTSNVTDMISMFGGATAFNRPLNNWDTSKVTDMSYMFSTATAFNQPLNNWNTSNVTDMSYMFCATAFNQPLNTWDTSNVKNMSSMFYNATAFNQPLNTWDTSNVKNMSSMFYNATAFNQPLNTWDTSNVRYMDSMFQSATAFNQPLDNWDISKVTSMKNIFILSHLTKDNFCKLFSGAYASYWEKYKSSLGIPYYTCK